MLHARRLRRHCSTVYGR